MLGKILTSAVAAEHFYILYLEMFAWTQKKTNKIFGVDAEMSQKTVKLAANQGLYNGFLAAGLCWALVHPDANIARQINFYFLGCVAVAGAYGALTVKPRIFFVQGLPAVLGLVAAALQI
eukprot:Colp12_sorted_trinity150504_noHs@11361